MLYPSTSAFLFVFCCRQMLLERVSDGRSCETTYSGPAMIRHITKNRTSIAHSPCLKTSPKYAVTVAKTINTAFKGQYLCKACSAVANQLLFNSPDKCITST